MLRGRNACNFLSSPRACVMRPVHGGQRAPQLCVRERVPCFGNTGACWGCSVIVLVISGPCSFSLELKPIHFGGFVLRTGGDVTHSWFPTTSGREPEGPTVLHSCWANTLLAMQSAICLSNSFLLKGFHCEKEEIIFFSMVTQHSLICHLAIFWRLPFLWQGNKRY